MPFRPTPSTSSSFTIPKLRSDLGEGRQDETSLPHPRVGQLKSPGIDGKVAQHQQIQVERARGVRPGPLATGRALDPQRRVQHPVGQFARLDLDGHVPEKPRIGDPDWLGLPHRGDPGQAEPGPVQAVQPGLEVGAAVAQIAAQCDVTGHEASIVARLNPPNATAIMSGLFTL